MSSILTSGFTFMIHNTGLKSLPFDWKFEIRIPEESGQLLKNLLKSWIVVGRKVAMPFPKSILNSSNEKSFKGLEKSNQGMFSFWLRNFFKSSIFFKMTTCWFICLLDNLSRCTTFLAPLFSLLTCWLDFHNFCGFSLLKGSSICLTGDRVLRLRA